MAKPRKKYSKKRPIWQYIVFYAVLGILIFGFILSLGFVRIEEINNKQTIQETLYFE